MDVGCGFGDTAIQIAKRVGPEGSVLGIDCCDAFLEYGRADAKAELGKHVTDEGVVLESSSWKIRARNP